MQGELRSYPLVDLMVDTADTTAEEEVHERGPSFTGWIERGPDVVCTSGNVVEADKPVKEERWLDKKFAHMVEDVNAIPQTAVLKTEDAALDMMTVYTALGGAFFQGRFLKAFQVRRPHLLNTCNL